MAACLAGCVSEKRKAGCLAQGQQWHESPGVCAAASGAGDGTTAPSPRRGEITLMTHFANADEAGGVAEPLALFNDVAAPYRISRSLANSAALLRYPETHGDWVRPGLMLYGASPFADASAQQFGLKPTMTLSSRIIAVQDLRAGDEIGYGGLF